MIVSSGAEEIGHLRVAESRVSSTSPTPRSRIARKAVAPSSPREQHRTR